eukprot:10382439-Lingulodinium_polyedra.AAC.1
MSRLEILRNSPEPKPIEDLLEGEALDCILNAASRIERSAEEVEALYQSGAIVPVQPYWDVRLRASPQLRLELFRRLIDVG